MGIFVEDIEDLEAFQNRFMFREDHEELPTVRITRVVLENFKSVKYGEIDFYCGKHFVPYGTKSDILGVYGQNGSGKTSLIEALSILERLMSGARVPDVYADCISVGADSSTLSFSFQLQYPDGEIRELEYTFSMKKEMLSKEELEDRYKYAPADYDIPETGYKVCIFNELFRMNRKDANKKVVMIKQDIIDTSIEDLPFSPAHKLEELIGKDKNGIIKLAVAKNNALLQSRSFIFCKDTLKAFKESGLYSLAFQTLIEMRYFASMFFFVVDTKSSGFIRLNFLMPIYTRTGLMQFDVRNPEVIPDEALEHFQYDVSRLSDVLGELVPGLSIGFKKISDTLTKDGKHGNIVMLMANRDGVELPLRDESDGVRKIISVLSLLIAAYNDQSFTLAIDEFDAGIFEYLLGEILQTLEESGKGQFIFTSHNLRPLEVIDKKFLVFTTTNPNNRYFRLKSIGKTNNLRDSYFREIILGEQEEEIYNKTKKFKIVAALRKAGIEE